MKQAPLVSIALCTYNGEKYLSRQLDSILSQTYTNLEIIVSDDCSTDGTFNMLNAYAEKDRRIKCRRNENNVGFNKNFEKAIGLTTGDYIAISDQDDIWLPEKIERLLANINDNWLIFSNSSFIDGFGEPIKGKKLADFNAINGTYKGILLANFVTGHTTLFKREVLKHLLPFPSGAFYDWWLGFVALYHHKAVALDEVLTKYRIHEASVMQQRLLKQQTKEAENSTIDHMLTAFASYKYLNAVDKQFIQQLAEAYSANLCGSTSVPLIRMIVKNYDELFQNHKRRKSFSLLNFAFKYARKHTNKA